LVCGVSVGLYGQNDREAALIDMISDQQEEMRGAYRVRAFLPLDARSAKRGIAIVSRPSVCLSVRLSVTLTYREHIGWTSSKLITRIISLGSSLLGATTSAIYSKGNTPKIRVE